MDEKRDKFLESASKRVNNIIHDIEILKPMARSNLYNFTKDDINQMVYAIEYALNSTKEEFERKFDENKKKDKKVFTFTTASQEIIENEEEF